MARRITQRLQDLSQTPFPEDLAEEVNGIDLKAVGTLAAGCLAQADIRGQLDDGRRRLLLQCEIALRRAIPDVPDGRKKYFVQLADLVTDVLEDA